MQNQAQYLAQVVNKKGDFIFAVISTPSPLSSQIQDTKYCLFVGTLPEYPEQCLGRKHMAAYRRYFEQHMGRVLSLIPLNYFI